MPRTCLGGGHRQEASSLKAAAAAREAASLVREDRVLVQRDLASLGFEPGFRIADRPENRVGNPDPASGLMRYAG